MHSLVLLFTRWSASKGTPVKSEDSGNVPQISENTPVSAISPIKSLWSNSLGVPYFLDLFLMPRSPACLLSLSTLCNTPPCKLSLQLPLNFVLPGLKTRDPGVTSLGCFRGYLFIWNPSTPVYIHLK